MPVPNAMPFDFAFDNTYARELQGLYVAWPPAAVPAPRLLFLNRELALDLGLDAAALAGPEGAALFAGNLVPEGAEPLAQAYAGHQFGGFSPQLGDGRALLLGEVVDRTGCRRDIAFKGSGRTPFSRGGDGKAAVGPMLREVLIGEAMHALGIPTTRALAVAATGEAVQREGGPLPGAVLTRVAASHLRVGTFQYFAARGEVDRLRHLADYALLRHDPALAGSPERYLSFLRAVAERQAALVAQWMNVGFIHGVMNTDNMTISGETIDYGPCAFMEATDPGAVFSSIDHGGRYAYGNQPHIARWNLARLAETLLPLMADGDDEAAVQRAVAQVTEVIDAFPALYDAALLQGQRAK
ncbi:MAG TPA: YdiU family protein, partial [Rubrivivax sp.]|nr:YdiU family protein [Rubrivivax sp.]